MRENLDRSRIDKVPAILRSLLALAMVGALASTVRAQSKVESVAPKPAQAALDWPAFLGPSGTGVTADAGLADHWPKGGPPILWSKKIGSGYSAPSVRAGKLVFHHRLHNESIVECLHADTGKSIWKVSYESTFSDPYGYNNGPRCTPLLTEKYCYTFGAEGKLLCVELATGRHVWARDVSKDFNVPQHFFGTGCTPILEGDLLIVLVGGQPNSGVVAFARLRARSSGKASAKALGTVSKRIGPTNPNTAGRAKRCPSATLRPSSLRSTANGRSCA